MGVVDHAVRKGSSWKHATHFFRKVLRNKFRSHCIASEADPWQGQSGRGPRYLGGFTGLNPQINCLLLNIFQVIYPAGERTPRAPPSVDQLSRT